MGLINLSKLMVNKRINKEKNIIEIMYLFLDVKNSRDEDSFKDMKYDIRGGLLALHYTKMHPSITSGLGIFITKVKFQNQPKQNSSLNHKLQLNGRILTLQCCNYEINMLLTGIFALMGLEFLLDF